MAQRSDLDQLARQVQGDAGCTSAIYGGCGFLGCGFFAWLIVFVVLPFGTLLGVPAGLLAGLAGALVGLRMAGASRRRNELAVRTALLAAGREDPLAPTGEPPQPTFDWSALSRQVERAAQPVLHWLASAKVLGRPAWQWVVLAFLVAGGGVAWQASIETARHRELERKQRARDEERARARYAEQRYAPRQQRDGVEEFFNAAFGRDEDAIAAIKDAEKHLRDRLPGKAALAIQKALRYTDLTDDAPARADAVKMMNSLATFARAIDAVDPAAAQAALADLPFSPEDRALLVAWLEAKATAAAAQEKLRQAKWVKPYEEERKLEDHLQAAAAFGRAVTRVRNAIAKEDKALAVMALFDEQPPRSFEYESPVTGVIRKVSALDRGTKRMIAEQELRDTQREVREAISVLPAYRGESSRLEVELWMQKQEGEGRRLEAQHRQALADKKLTLSHAVTVAESNLAAAQDAEWNTNPGAADWEPLVAALKPLYPKPSRP